MFARLSSKGQLVILNAIRQRLGLRTGDRLELDVQDRRIVVTPVVAQRYKVEIVTDQKSGLSILTAEPGAPVLTSEDVAAMLN